VGRGIECLDDGEKPPLPAKFFKVDETPDRNRDKGTDQGCCQRYQEGFCGDLKNFLVEGDDQLDGLDDAFDDFVHLIKLHWCTADKWTVLKRTIGRRSHSQAAK